MPFWFTPALDLSRHYVDLQRDSTVADVLEARPHNTAALMLRALVQADLGQERQAVADLIRATLEATTDVDTQAYRRALRAYADELAPAAD